MSAKRNSDSITELKEYLISLIGNAPFGIFTLGLDGAIAIINAKAAKFFGRDPTALVDLPLLELTGSIPSLRSEAESFIRDGRHEFDIKEEEVDARFYTIRGRVILSGMLVVIEDVTEEVLAREKQAGLMTELERKNRELEEFAYVSAHDMKSPLASLSGLMEKLHERDGIKDASKPLWEMMGKTVLQMQRTVTALNQVMAFHKTLAVIPKTLEFGVFFREVLDSIASIIESENVRIESDFSRCKEVLFPETHLRSIFLNLVTNAIKYRRPECEIKIEVESGIKDGRPFLSVKDNGMGIDLQRYGGKLFKLFSRFHPDIEGAGVGLHMLQTMIESYGGSIQVKSEVGKGSEFIVRF